MRKRDHFKSITPFIFTTFWIWVFYEVGITSGESHLFLAVSALVLLIAGSVMITDYMFDFFDKNDNEEDEF